MSGRKGGRPSKIDLEERKRRKKAWQREKEDRRQIESRIKQGLVNVVPWGETLEDSDSLDYVLFAAPPFPPAIQFLLNRVKGIPEEEFCTT